MFERRLLSVVIGISLLVGVVASVRLLAAERPKPTPPPVVQLRPAQVPVLPTSMPVTTAPVVVPRVTAALVNMRGVLQGFKRNAQLQTDFMKLQQAFAQASRAGEQAKAMELRQKMQQFGENARKEIFGAVEAVAKREQVEVIVSEVLYSQPNITLPDLTPQVTEYLNATTSAPASEPAASEPAASEPALTSPPVNLP